MGFADAKGQTSGAVTSLLDVTHRGFEPTELDLLPRGLAWDPEDPLRRALVAGQCTELSRVDIRAQELQRELDPHTTFALIDDWETELGLPECSAPETLEARRGAVLARAGSTDTTVEARRPLIPTSCRSWSGRRRHRHAPPPPAPSVVYRSKRQLS